jgi:hypothetical protein
MKSQAHTIECTARLAEPDENTYIDVQEIKSTALGPSADQNRPWPTVTLDSNQENRECPLKTIYIPKGPRSRLEYDSCSEPEM